MTDLLLLRSFLATAEARAITPAARLLFVTQPALSRRLQQLEEELGVVLFERSARGVALTEEGRFVQREGRDLIERYEHMRAGVTAISKRLELGVVTLPIDPSLVGDFEVTPLVTDRMVLVAAKSHPFAKKKRIAAKRLDGEDLVGFESPSAIRSLIDGALRDAGVHVNVVMELRSIPAILRMVATTGRLAFVSKLGIGRETDSAKEVHALSVTGLNIARDLAIIRKRGRPLSPAAAEFAATLARVCRRQSPPHAGK